MQRRWCAAALAAGLVLAACGDDDDDAGRASDTGAGTSETSATGVTSAPSETTTSAESGTSVPAEDVDPTLAQPGLLTAADLPAGWVEQPPDDDSDDVEFADVPACAPLASLDDLPYESEAEVSFEAPDNSGQIDHTVTVAAPEDAQAAFDAFASPEALGCIQAVFDVFAQAITADGGEATPLAAAAEPVEAGDEAVSYVASATVTTADGASAPIELRVTIVHGGRSVAQLFTLAVGPPVFDVVALAQLAGERAAAIV